MIGSPPMATIEPTDVIGSRLSAALAGTYTIERELGGAGMSRVFEARETALDRRVVIKVVTADVGAGVSADRFRREIQVAATLRHPHIVPLLAAGEAAGILYYSMPLIDGESLQQRLARTGPLPVSEVVHLAEEVADALDHAHRLGVIHRDIKPANILLEDEHAIVADFGIARAVSKATEHEGHALTITGLVLGTPLYMSPEQGGGDEVDGRTDIYALGCVMYQMLAGKPPFEGTNAQQIILAHFVKEPPPIDRGDVPDALRDVVRQAMAKDPEQRFASAALMRNALRSLDTRHLPSSPPAVNTTRSFRAVPTGPVSTSLTSG
ncbi:MAG TPA: serine/threonine-protein kinase, partial [Gemmatimonadaceae bacterium]|nr:serine/threonine-protein kinase [Gemmatimonadaceae bacterium]